MFIDRNIKKNYNLNNLTTFHTRGLVDFFIKAANKKELAEAINWARRKNIRYYFLGDGSNILFTKKKISGLIIKIAGDEYIINKRVITSWPGTKLATLVKAAFVHSLSGLEWARGIPGSLGGAVYGNAGAYGSNISATVLEIEAFDISKNKYLNFDHQACGFSYKESVFKQNKNLVIVKVKLKLNQGKKDKIGKLAKQNFHNRLKTLPQEPSAGCVFKNLEYDKLVKINQNLAKELRAKNLVKGGKISTAYLIDRLGLKGRVSGGACISHRHANFIINTGRAEPGDILKLVKLIRKKMKSKFNIDLEDEIQFLGK